MKTKLLSLCLVALLCGCAGVQTNPGNSQRIADHVAYDVCSVVLEKHPEWRPALITAKNDLEMLENQPAFDTLAVIEIIQRLPVEELQSANSRISIDGVMLIIELNGNPSLKPESQEPLRAVVRGLRVGLGRRLSEPETKVRAYRPRRQEGLPPVPTYR